MLGKIDAEVVEKFKIFQEQSGEYEGLDIETVLFEKVVLVELAKFPAKTRISGKVDLSIGEYKKLTESEKENYFALVSGTVENNQISGYIFKERLSKNSLSKPNAISWTRINSENFFIQNKPVCTNDDSFVMEVNDENNVKFIQQSTITTMRLQNFHWGNKAGKTKIMVVKISIPKPLNNYTSYQIQEAIVAFLEFWKVEYTDVYRTKIKEMTPFIKTMQEQLISATFRLDRRLKESFNEFAIKKGFDIKLEEIELEDLSLADRQYFEFIKGKNHYIKRYNENNLGEIPLATGSVKNESLAYYVKPISDNDIIYKECISYNKDGDTTVFYRNFNFLMDRHHVATVPTKKIASKYLYFVIQSVFKKNKYGWGENVASVEEVQSNYIPIPTHPQHNSIDLQKLLVEFWEMILDNLDERLKLFERVKELCDEIDEAFLYKTFSKIEWGER